MTSLYKRLLGHDYHKLPQTVQELHDVTGIKTYRGSCSAERGSNIINRILATLLMLPKTQSDIPLSVTFSPDGTTEKWTRHFGKDRFVTVQWDQNGLLYEKLSFVTLVFSVDTTTDQLSLDLKNVLFLGLPVAWLFKPRVTAIEFEQNGVFHLSITVNMPVTGLLIKYNGFLQKDNA